jgi:hypothetical protein
LYEQLKVLHLQIYINIELRGLQDTLTLESC